MTHGTFHTRMFRTYSMGHTMNLQCEAFATYLICSVLAAMRLGRCWWRGSLNSTTRLVERLLEPPAEPALALASSILPDSLEVSCLSAASIFCSSSAVVFSLSIRSCGSSASGSAWMLLEVWRPFGLVDLSPAALAMAVAVCSGSSLRELTPACSSRHCGNSSSSQ